MHVSTGNIKDSKISDVGLIGGCGHITGDSLHVH